MSSQNSINNTVSDNDFSTIRGTAGTPVANITSHTDNTNTSSNAYFRAIVGGASGGDPFLHLQISGTTEYSFGIDNTDSDILKLTDSSDPSTGTELLTIDSSGNVNIPKQLNIGTPFSSVVDTAAEFANEFTEAGGQVAIANRNLSNTANSHAIIATAVAGTSAGNAFFKSAVVGSNTYSFGTRASDGLFYITADDFLAATELLSLTNTGAGNIVGSLAVGASALGTDVYLQNSFAIAGDYVGTYTTNTDNTNAASHAFYSCETGGTSSGDPFYLLSIAGTTYYSLGIDNSDSDILKITDSNQGPSFGNEILSINGTTDAIFGVAELQVNKTNVGSANHLDILNDDNTSGTSNAYALFKTGGASGGDPFIAFQITGVGQYSFGIDNSDGDILKICDNSPPGAGNERFAVIGPTGNIRFNNAFTFPVTDGSANQVLKTNGAGTVSWASADINTTGTGQTVGNVTADIITLAAGATPGVYTIEATVAGFESAGPTGAGYQLFGVVRTTGAAATIVSTITTNAKEEAALASADATIVVSGNNIIVRVTGVVARTINWVASLKYIFRS